MAVEVKRDLNGRLKREEVAKMIREVVVDTNVERVRKNAKRIEGEHKKRGR